MNWRGLFGRPLGRTRLENDNYRFEGESTSPSKNALLASNREGPTGAESDTGEVGYPVDGDLL